MGQVILMLLQVHLLGVVVLWTGPAVATSGPVAPSARADFLCPPQEASFSVLIFKENCIVPPMKYFMFEIRI